MITSALIDSFMNGKTWIQWIGQSWLILALWNLTIPCLKKNGLLMFVNIILK